MQAVPFLPPFWHHVPVQIRPVHAGDVEPILAMHGRLSPDSRYARYLSAYTPGYREIEQICQLDGETGAAWVVVADSAQPLVVGLAYYVIAQRKSPVGAEVAFLVEDLFQGQGLGQRLCQLLCEHALMRGVHVLHAHTLLRGTDTIMAVSLLGGTVALIGCAFPALRNVEEELTDHDAHVQSLPLLILERAAV